MLDLRDYDLFDCLSSHLQVHFEEMMGVELVVDEESIAFGDCVDQG